MPIPLPSTTTSTTPRGTSGGAPTVAVILSLLVPGLGQLYRGRLVGGVGWFVLVGLGYVAFVIPGLVLHLLCILAAGMGDPYR